MYDYILHSLPTAVLVLAHFFRTERRLTRIETLIELLMDKNGCKPKRGIERGKPITKHS